MNEEILGVTYTEVELSDLKALREGRAKYKKRLRSGNPQRVRVAEAFLKAIEVEVQKIHRAAEQRAYVEGLTNAAE